ncbi:MAG: dihydrofolate reductase family protein [Actinomycetales bacterium]|nr:dihydrofolate reductase family protein [Actinomycetales bacterium]
MSAMRAGGGAQTRAIGHLDDVSLADAYPWPQGPWLRAMMVTTLDGAAVGPDGRSGSISCAADRRVFAETRRLCDAVLVGAGTIRAERYRPMLAKAEHAEQRAELGLAVAPVVAIVSAAADLPWQEPLFSESALPVLVLASQSAPADRLSLARRHAEVIALPGERLDPREVVRILHERGLRRIVCEGGPMLLRHVAQAGLIDEADISVAPVIAGGGQVVTGPAFDAPIAFDLVQVAWAEGFAFQRYLARRP